MALDERQRALLQEFAIRQARNEQTEKVCAAIIGECFDKQRAFIEDPSKYKAALCTRRAGKSSMWVRYCTATALRKPRGLIRIWCISRLRAKQLFWSEFLYLLARHKIKAKTHETELTITFENGAEIRLVGADKDKEVQKKRGDKTDLEVIVESQLFGPFLKTLTEDVIGPSLLDNLGTICLEGTPGPLCIGQWWEITGREDFAPKWASVGNPVTGDGRGWSVHRWSLLDNPHLPHARKWLVEEKARKRWTDDNPTYVREYMGRWVNDLGTLYYAFDPVRNIYTPDEIQPWGPGWEHVLGWDLGSRDDMALVVWGFHPHIKCLYEAFSWKQPGAGIDDIKAQIDGLRERGFNITQMVADTQGGGRMFVEEFMRRHPDYPFEAAKKSDKYDHVLLFSDDLRTARAKLAAGSPYAEEIAALARDLEWEGPVPREKPGIPNHACDAGLYSWRAAYHYLATAEVKPLPEGSPEWYDEKLKKVLLHRERKRSSPSQWWEQ